MYVVSLRAIEEHLKKRRVTGTLYIAKRHPRSAILARLAGMRNVPVAYVSTEELRRIYDGKQRGVVLELSGRHVEPTPSLQQFLKTSAEKASLVVLLDGITDPHNLGAILRTADLFSVDAVVVTSRKSAHSTAAVHSVSAGASAWVELLTHANLVDAMRRIKRNGFWVYGADLSGKRLGTLDFGAKVGLVLGSEAAGMRRSTAEACDELVRIPTSGHVDSFNVAVAAGILMYEIRRQQKYYRD